MSIVVDAVHVHHKYSLYGGRAFASARSGRRSSSASSRTLAAAVASALGGFGSIRRATTGRRTVAGPRSRSSGRIGEHNLRSMPWTRPTYYEFEAVCPLPSLIAAARAAGAHRQLVADQSPAAPRQDGWAAGQALPVLLAPAGREPPDPTPVRVDAPADLGAARADRLTGERCRRPWAKRGRKAGEVSVRMSVASCRALKFGPPGGFFDARSIRGGILTRARMVGVGCDRSTVVKSEMSAQKEEVSFLIAQDHIGFLSAAPGGLLLTAMWHKSVRMAETFLALCGKGFRLSVCSCSMATHDPVPGVSGREQPTDDLLRDQPGTPPRSPAVVPEAV